VTHSRVIQLARLGDFLQSLPLCRALRAQGPLELVLAFDPGTRLRGEADRLHVVEPWSLARATRNPAVFLHRLRDALGGMELHSREVELQVCLNEDPSAIGLARLLPARRRSGAGQPGDAYALWLRLAVEQRHANHVQLSEAMLACLPGVETPAPTVLEPGSGDVILHAGSGSPARRLPTEFWVQLAQQLLERIPHRRLLLTGGLLEVQASAELAKRIARPDRVLDVAGTLDLDELQDLLESAALVVAQDTGVLHLAAHLRRPLIGLYHGSASARETAPWLSGAHVLGIQAECAPCVEGRPTCTDYFCRSRIRPEAVAELSAALVAGSAWTDLSTAECAHQVCRADVGGVALWPAAGEADARVTALRHRQLALVRGLGFERSGADLRMEQSQRWAMEAGLTSSAQRRREWFTPPEELEGRWHWMRARNQHVADA
jgi:hypothetical protein